MKQKVRVRIAPSPTGDPHVGLAYITLFNYVFAKKFGGSLILRIEDTDQQRFSPNSESQIMDSLRWLGLKWDEGPDIGGEHGPYKQSMRLDIYHKHAEMLVKNGKAYHCFCSSSRLDELRAKQRETGLNPGYDGHCRKLSKAQITEQLAKNQPHVLRLSVPDDGMIGFTDELRGPIEIPAKQIDDQVILKSDGFPTYHLANVVDDHLMEITHVIRAEEWISSTPKHVLLYEAFGWKPPQFIHMPILRNSDHSKISKRKNPVSLYYYKRKGILPKAMLNFLGLMGWSFSADQEIFSITEMIDAFELKQMHLGGPIFDLVKLAKINQHYVQAQSADEFAHHMREEIFSEKYLKKLHPLIKDRFETFEEFVDRFGFFFNGALDLTNLEIIPKGKDAAAFSAILTHVLEGIEKTKHWNHEEIEKLLHNTQQELGLKPKDLLMPIRLITTGRKDSPPLVETLEALGKEIVRFRINQYANKP